MSGGSRCQKSRINVESELFTYAVPEGYSTLADTIAALRKERDRTTSGQEIANSSVPKVMKACAYEKLLRRTLLSSDVQTIIHSNGLLFSSASSYENEFWKTIIVHDNAFGPFNLMLVAYRKHRSGLYKKFHSVLVSERDKLLLGGHTEEFSNAYDCYRAFYKLFTGESRGFFEVRYIRV